MGKATFVKQIEGWKGDARLYELSEPLTATEDHEATKYVIVSAVVVGSENVMAFWGGTGPETYIFPADENGKALDMMELPGSFKGGLDHNRALLGLGYELVAPKPTP